MKIKVRRIFNGTIFLSTETSIDTEVEISALSEQKEIIDVFIQAKWSEDGDIWISHPLFLLYSKIELVIRAQGEEETSFFVHFNYLDPHNLSNFVDEEQLVKYRKEGAPERISFGCTDLIFSHPYKYFKENPEEDKPVLLNVSSVAGIGDA